MSRDWWGFIKFVNNGYKNEMLMENKKV